MTNQGKYINYTEKTITEQGLKNSSAWIVPKNSILYSIYASVGFVAINNINLSTSQAIYSIILKDNIDIDYIYYYLLNLKKSIHKYIETGTQGNLNSKIVQNFTIKIPTLNEQKRISNFLSLVDRKIELLEKKYVYQLKFSEKFLDEIMNHKYVLNDFNENWYWIKLNDIGKTYNGLSGKNKNDFNKGSSKYIPYISISKNYILNTNDFEFVDVTESENQNSVKKGDIFFTGSSETPEEVGMAAVLTKDINNCYLNSFCFGFRLNSKENYNPLFLVYYFRSFRFKKILYKLAQGSTRFNLSKKELMKQKIEIPCIEEQNYYTKIITLLFKKTKEYNSQINYLKEFKMGLLQKMFV